MALPDSKSAAPCVVLDTNAVLDWLVFRNPAMQPWAHAIDARRIRWLGCTKMRDEAAHMVVHASLARWQPDARAILATIDALCTWMPVPSALPDAGLRCTDADDQIFIDLAITQGARWLLTQDRAVLKLARKAALRGVTIFRPADGQP